MWDGRTLLKAVEKDYLLQVKEVSTNSLVRLQEEYVQAGMPGLGILWIGRQEPSNTIVAPY